MPNQTFNLTAGKIVAKVLVGGVPTLTTFTTPASSFTMPHDGTFTIGWDYKDSTGAALTTPRFVLFPGQSNSAFPDMLPLHLVTQMGSTFGSGRITHAIDKRQLGGIGSSNIQSSSVNSTHLDPALIASLTAAGQLATLTDVHLVSPMNHDVLSYNAGTAKWTNTVAASGGGGSGGGTGATNLNGLSDVAYSAPTAGQFFEFNGSVWTNVSGVTYAQLPTSITGTINSNGTVNSSHLTGTIPASCYTPGSPTLAGDSDVALTTLSANQYLKWNGTKWVNSAAPAASIATLTDVYFSGSPSNQEVLMWNGADWSNSAIPKTGFNDITDFHLYSVPTNGQVIMFDTAYATTDYPGEWVNGNAPGGTLASLTDCSIGTPSNGETLQFTSSDSLWHAHIPVFNDLTDVRITSPGGNNYLGYNGTDNLWENAPISTYSLSDFSYVRAPLNGDVIAFNATDGYWETTTPTPPVSPLPIANGGTGSTTQNWVGLTGNQTVAGTKTFSSAVTAPTVLSKANGATASYVPPILTIAGAAVAATAHIVQGQVTAGTGTSTTLTFTNAAIFANTKYSMSIIDTSVSPFTNASVTAMTSSSITFTSVNTHIYNYNFCGV